MWLAATCYNSLFFGFASMLVQPQYGDYTRNAPGLAILVDS